MNEEEMLVPTFAHEQIQPVIDLIIELERERAVRFPATRLH